MLDEGSEPAAGPGVDDAPAVRQALRELVAARKALAALEVELVRTARLEGASWTTIGEDLGLSRQAARARHLAIDPLPRRSERRGSGLDAYLAQLKASRGTASA